MKMSTADIAFELGNDYILYRVGKAQPNNVISKYAQTLRRVGDILERKYDTKLSAIIRDFQPGYGRGLETMFVSVTNEMLNDEALMNWGRVIMVYVFAARLAVYYQENGPERYTQLSEYAGKCIASNCTTWIEDQGGWKDFHDSFKPFAECNVFSAFKRWLVTASIMVGLAAVRLFMLCRNS